MKRKPKKLQDVVEPWNVDNITRLWDEEVKKLPLWNVDNITKLWDEKVIELRLNSG